MASEKDINRLSKFLSLVLRHKPETIGITLDQQGWTSVDILINKISETGLSINRELLQEVVATNNKKRFSFNETQDLIRASQGHSIDIDAGYPPKEPPAILYHGTSVDVLDTILRIGLVKMSRQHVHLSSDVETALTVGRRHGKPVVLQVQAHEMWKAGYQFFFSDNGVWLTDVVPGNFLKNAVF